MIFPHCRISRHRRHWVESRLCQHFRRRTDSHDCDQLFIVIVSHVLPRHTGDNVEDSGQLLEALPALKRGANQRQTGHIVHLACFVRDADDVQPHVETDLVDQINDLLVGSVPHGKAVIGFRALEVELDKLLKTVNRVDDDSLERHVLLLANLDKKFSKLLVGRWLDDKHVIQVAVLSCWRGAALQVNVENWSQLFDPSEAETASEVFPVPDMP